MDQKILLNSVVDLAKNAGQAIMGVYQNDSIPVQIKADYSPVTEADLAAHTIISAGLNKLTPPWPILSEEDATISFAERKQWQRYWLVDPLDGTKDFLEKNSEFTVNIALIENGRPILGVVYAPALDTCYFAYQQQGAFKQVNNAAAIKIQTRKYQSPLMVAMSRHHGQQELQQFLQKLTNYQTLTAGSSLKFCLVAEGVADIYPRLSPTSEWDTAAAQCVLEQAGGAVINSEGLPLSYNNKASLENPAFLAVGDKQFNWVKYF